MKSLPILLTVCLLSFSGVAAQAGDSAFDRDHVIETMEKVADVQWGNEGERFYWPSYDRHVEILDRGWIRAAFYAGVIATWETTGEQRFYDRAVAWGEHGDWFPEARFRHADDIACAQTFLSVYEEDRDPVRIKAVDYILNSIVKNPMRGPEVGWKHDSNWAWCDALFMAPPVFAHYAAITGDTKYIDTMHILYTDTTDLLWAEDYDLYYRDYRFLPGADPELLTPTGKPVFWSRGNGWVFAGLPRVIKYLPEDWEHRAFYEDTFKKMAAALAKTQHDDGLWRASLLDDTKDPNPETSGTGFFCYGMAWGVNNGLLDEAEYLPRIRAAWAGLMKHVDEEGVVRSVQEVGFEPTAVQWDHSFEYGTGAFLLAGSEVVKLIDAGKL